MISNRENSVISEIMNVPVTTATLPVSNQGKSVINKINIVSDTTDDLDRVRLTPRTQILYGDHMEEAIPILEEAPPVLEEVKPITSIFDKGVQPFNDWICPILAKLMVDPVVAQDGYSYERIAIETWLATHDTSPMDRSNITNKKLHKNIALSNIIKDWVKNNPEYMRDEAMLDRQLDEQALRIKPVVTSPVISRSPSQYITRIASVTFPGWNIVNLDNNIMYGNRSPRGAHHTPRTLGIIPRALSFSLSPQNSARVVPV